MTLNFANPDVLLLEGHMHISVTGTDLTLATSQSVRKSVNKFTVVGASCAI